MTSEPLAFFTLDRGTATTAAALVAPFAGRFRILASGSLPAGVEAEALLEDLAWRVARTAPDVLGPADAWPGWARLEVRTTSLPRICLVAATTESGRALERAFSNVGWDVAATFSTDQLDVLALGRTCLDASVAAVGLALESEAAPERRASILAAWDLALALASMRDDLAVLACGPIAQRPEGGIGARVNLLPPPEAGEVVGSALLSAARDVAVAAARRGQGRRAMDGREALRTTIGSLAVLLDRRVDAVEVGAAAGSRTLAGPQGEIGHLVHEGGALVPAAVMQDDEAAAAILRWSTLRGDTGAHVDRLRNLRLAPWRELAGDGARLRLAALRGALARLASGRWPTSTGAHDEGGAADIVLLSGGVFAAVPPPACALAVIDTLRVPGAFSITVDHARVLAPIGTLPDEGDRRRLLADLLDDALLPLGSAVLTGELSMVGRAAGLMQVSTSLGQEQVPLIPGTLRLVDLPPGIAARIEMQAREGGLMGTRAQRVTLEVGGGLAGLLVDTRETPLRLPEAADRRRSLLSAWEAAAWPGGEQ